MCIKPDCIIPAAGESRRMGMWKLLLQFGETTMIERCIDTALKVCGRIIVVTGFRGDELEELLNGRENIVLIRNKNYKRGIFSSIQTGAGEVKTSRFFIVPGDMPLIDKSVYDDLLALRETEAARPVFKEIPGHPVLLSEAVKSRILEPGPINDMKEILNGFNCLRTEVINPNVCRDIDTPEDYNKLVNG